MRTRLRKSKATIRLGLVLLLLGHRAYLPAQTPDQLFGQNRVQYKDFVWSYYESEHFTVFFYLGGQELARFVVLDAEKTLPLIEKQLEYRLGDKIDIIVYNTIDDLKQSNIGLGYEAVNTGGLTRIMANKMFLYFDGNYLNLHRQIREGIAGILLQTMLFGGSVGEVVQNVVLLKVPQWFTHGLSSYIGEAWSPQLDNLLRNGINSGRYRKLNKLSGSEARYAGHALWYYIATRYGPNAVTNLLYISRMNRSIEAGFTYVFNKGTKEFIEEFYNYYKNLFAQDASLRKEAVGQKIKLSRPARRHLTSVHLNSDGSKLLYVVNHLGRYRLYLQDTGTRKKTCLWRGGFKTTALPVDYSQPLVAFAPSGDELALLFWRRNKSRLVLLDAQGRKKEHLDLVNFQKVFAMSYMDAHTLALSAMNRGQTDIYLYNLRSGRLEQITNDPFSDLSPHFIRLPTRQGLLFSSNRPVDSLRPPISDTLRPLHNFNLFFYNIRKKSTRLLQVTRDDLATETDPISFGKHYFSFLSDANGIGNRFVGYIDSVFSHYDRYYFFPDSTVINPEYPIDSLIAVGVLRPDSTAQVPVFRDTARSWPVTNTEYSLLDQDAARRGNTVAASRIANGRYEVVLNEVPRDTAPQPTEVPWTPYQRSVAPRSSPAPPSVKPATPQPSEKSPVRQADTVAQIREPFFISEFTGKPNRMLLDTLPEKHKAKPWRFSRVLPYSLRMTTATITTQLDNSLIVTRYQPFDAYGGQFSNPNLNVFFSTTVMDLLEDYRITGGFRFPTQFNGTEYFFLYENLKHRLDKRFTVYRRSVSVVYDATPAWYLPVNARLRTYLVDASFRYPLDFLRSFRFSFSYRNDRTNYLATDSFSLGLPQSYDDWLMTRAEFVFDNALKLQTNIYDGLRFKFYVDAQRQIDRKNTYLFAAGTDARGYLPVHRNLILASRVQAATTWGDQKVVFFMGSAENELFPTFDISTPVSREAGYAFQTLATTMRGFPQNVRNGNSFLLVNCELRWPVFAYLINSPIRSETIRNFQLITFIDAGTAWQGLNPYSKDNPFNTKYYQQGPIFVKVNYFREPMVFAWGFGARSTLLGYFLRLDYARGLDSGAWKPWRWHLSIGLDF
ncbi:MAG: hypothetical protein NZL95_08615 [Chitinophagales bacterium]|nr:hypothetical protein [Chitinophagales bacterium]MDW8428599.1 hypothetical protein [Chitinophagales bacterium]